MSVLRTLLLALALTSALASAARGSAPASPTEAFERVMSRFASGDADGAEELLDDAHEQGLATNHRAVDVILATAGDADAA